MRILFFGGTGFVGQRILRALIRHDHEVTFVTRGNHKPKNIIATHICGDRKDSTTLDKAKIQGPWDAIIDNIAYTAQDVIDTISVLEANHYILTSTIAVCYPWRPIGLGPANIPSSYSLNKASAEQAVKFQTKMPWTIFRPGIVYGPGEALDRTMWYMNRLLEGQPIYIANTKNLVSFVFCEDIAPAYLSALSLPDSKRCSSYNLCQDEYLAMDKFIDDHARYLGITPIIRRVPITQIRDQGGPYSYDFDFIASNQNTKANLDWQPTRWEAAVKQSIEWFRRKYESLKSDPTNNGGGASGQLV